jgi:hypothetical protein
MKTVKIGLIEVPLSQKWPEWRIVNKGIMGWGTIQAYLTLSKMLQDGKRPSMVIYNMIPEHLPRNYIRKSWVQMMGDLNFFHPQF